MEQISFAADRWSASRPDRQVLAPCGMCGAVAGVPCRPGFVHAGRRFELAVCWPGVRLGGAELGVVDRRCVATVESTYDWDFTAPSCLGEPATREAIVFRGACLGCAWAAATSHRDCENPAIEDALDHALAGWRQVPITERLRSDANAKQRTVWLTQIDELYASYGLDARLGPGAGGVIRTVRSGCGTRSHWSAGFYDICAQVLEDRPPSTGPTATQLDLFP